MLVKLHFIETLRAVYKTKFLRYTNHVYHKQSVHEITSIEKRKCFVYI